MEGHPLLGNGLVNTSCGKEYATIACPMLGSDSINSFPLKHVTVCFLCNPWQRVIRDNEGHLQSVIAEKP
jgi:hypothetical protein